MREIAHLRRLPALHDICSGWIAGAAALSLIALMSWLLLNAALSAAHRPQDFFQDYISARRLLAGQSLYPDLAPFRSDFPEPAGGFGITGRGEVNAHPPVSILLALPVAGLPYSTATWVWEVTGVMAYIAMWWLILDGLSIRPVNARDWFTITLAAVCFPALLESLAFVTMSPYISLLLVAVWYCYRRGQRDIAGMLLALAISLKLYPALLIGVFLVRRDQRTALATSATTAAIFLVTLPLLGAHAYEEYLSVLHRTTGWLPTPWNWSLAGFFGRLFTDAPDVVPIVNAPWLATVLTSIACGVLISLPAAVALRAHAEGPHLISTSGFDALYSCGLILLLLVSPVSWPHYSSAAVLVWCFAFRREMLSYRRRSLRRQLLTCIALLFILYPWVARLGPLAVAFFTDQMKAGAAANLVLWPLYTYALIAMLVLTTHQLWLTGRGLE